MERAFRLDKFRNFGLKKPVKFVINHTLEPGKMGDLIILIGPNNSGKSNILDAMKAFKNKKLTPRDITTLSFAEENRNPIVSFYARDRKAGWRYAKNVSLKGSDYFSEDPDDNATYKKEEIAKVKKDINDIYDIHYQILIKNNCSTTANNLNNLEEEVEKIKTIQELEAFANKLYDMDICSKYRSELKRDRNMYYSSSLRSEVRNLAAAISKTDLYKKAQAAKENNVELAFKNKFKVNLVPNIIEYSPKEIRESDLICEPSKIRNNSFYVSLFSEEEIKEIEHVYETFKTYQNMAIFSELLERFEFKTDEISKRFNKMYFADKTHRYKFSFIFESGKVGFGIKHGSKSINLSVQSVGFRWFFNFYFSFLNTTNFESGDIIIMDEPATNLHPYGQFELRGFIKDLAKKLDITFVIATHSPFLIDVNNYDELRIVSSLDNESKIENLFSAINYDDPDTLLPIKDALTIKQSVLYDEDTKKIFVEGILDYNYLTLFKNILGIKNLAFIPIQGVGNSKELREKILSKLIKINHSPTLLVDGDSAGLKAAEFSKGKDITVISVNEAVPGCLEIEDLFSKQDQIKHKIDKEDKDSFRSSLLKNTTSKDDFTSETIKNFEKILKYLESI